MKCRLVRAAAILVSTFGLGACFSYATVDWGRSVGGPNVESVQVKRWTNEMMPSIYDLIPTDHGVMKTPDELAHPKERHDWFGVLCDNHLSAWCDANGNWCIANDITNHAVPHHYSFRLDFGHIDNGDWSTFVPYAKCITPVLAYAPNQSQTVTACGAANAAIREHFAEINAVRPIPRLEDTETIFAPNRLFAPSEDRLNP